MAYQYDDTTPDYHFVNSGPISAEPLSIACWFQTDDVTPDQMVISVGDATPDDMWGIELNNSPQVVRAKCYDGGVFQHAESGTTYTADTWHHACATFASDTSRTIWLDGAGEGSNATGSSPGASDEIAIGIHIDRASDPLSGMIAEVGIWSTTFTIAEALQLAAGYSPLLVRPESLVCYIPLIRGLGSVVGDFGLTASGSPTAVAHPPVMYATSPYGITGPSAAGVTLSIAIVPTDSSYDIAKPIIVG